MSISSLAKRVEEHETPDLGYRYNQDYRPRGAAMATVGRAGTL
jgi:hypothetical protein